MTEVRLENFIDELYKAGWQDTGDAKHVNIKYLHKQLFPVVAELEEEINELIEETYKTAYREAFFV